MIITIILVIFKIIITLDRISIFVLAVCGVCVLLLIITAWSMGQ
jgi:hypothetical protein